MSSADRAIAQRFEAATVSGEAGSQIKSTVTKHAKDNQERGVITRSVTPRPDTAFLVARSAQKGFRSDLAIVLGIGRGAVVLAKVGRISNADDLGERRRHEIDCACLRQPTLVGRLIIVEATATHPSVTIIHRITVRAVTSVNNNLVLEASLMVEMLIQKVSAMQ